MGFTMFNSKLHLRKIKHMFPIHHLVDAVVAGVEYVQNSP